MNGDAFRYLYDYHFTQNHKIWDMYVTPLLNEQFTQSVDYSQRSIRDRILHLMNIDEIWFSFAVTNPKRNKTMKSLIWHFFLFWLTSDLLSSRGCKP
jgi:hypothetical protein